MKQGQVRRFKDPAKDAVSGPFTVVCVDDGWCWLRYPRFGKPGHWQHESRRAVTLARESTKA